MGRAGLPSWPAVSHPSSDGTPPGTADLLGELAREVDRVADRLRVLAPQRLVARADPYGQSVAAVARATAQLLADSAAALEAPARGRRELPQLPRNALGDQVAVTGHDLLSVLAEHPDEGVTRSALASLQALRRVLP